MDNGLYSVLTTCPICEKSFNVVKVKSSAFKLDRVDEDFCMHYKEINPLLYDPWICEHCGYAGYESNFAALSGPEIEALKKLCLDKFTQDPSKNPFELAEFHKKVYKYLDSLNSNGERDLLTALEAFEILILALEARNAPSSLKAKTLMRIGWIYRFMENPKELEYLKEAANCFINAYQMEPLPIGKFDYVTCAYLIGELNRRAGNLKEAMHWFGQVLRLPQTSETSKIFENTRDQIQLVKRSPGYASLK
ncbi:MAG: hypothetical protein CVU84_10100 [Firmicutes bacterium HGW-Firmicutes-1]|jgi:hypothetical protein|nr:MAG: hypothetical protein CVU84_10100 [Firmicutes bacterium HGW-Firmicutes-1]